MIDHTIIGKPECEIPVTVYTDALAIGDALANTIVEGIVQAAQEGRRYLLGCPGGRSPMTTYQAIGRYAVERNLDLSHVIIVMMDEYLFRSGDRYINCPPDAHFSCHRFAYEDIVNVINDGIEPSRHIKQENIWFPNPAQPGEYDERIRAAGGINLFIIATGASDGHVAFNPPGDAGDSMTRIIPLPDSTRTDNMVTFPGFTDLSEVPSFGVSVGLGTIAKFSRQVALIAHGEDKQYAMRRLVECGDFQAQWPASIIYRCRDAQVLVDEAAAAGMNGALE